MSEREFTVRGAYPARYGEQNFEKRLEAPNEDVAVEYVYSQLGSQLGLKRTQVQIQEVEG